jgi:chitinase
MTYDYHGQWDKITGHVAPMYPHPDDVDVTLNAVIHHLIFPFNFSCTHT